MPLGTAIHSEVDTFLCRELISHCSLGKAPHPNVGWKADLGTAWDTENLLSVLDCGSLVEPGHVVYVCRQPCSLLRVDFTHSPVCSASSFLWPKFPPVLTSTCAQRPCLCTPLLSLSSNWGSKASSLWLPFLLPPLPPGFLTYPLHLPSLPLFWIVPLVLL